MFGISSFFSIIGVDPHHDGVILKPAIDTVQNKTLFKDTFTFYGALSTYINFIALSILGQSLLSIRLATSFFYGLTALFIWLFSSKILSKKLSYLVVFLWISLAPYYIEPFYPWPSVYAAFFTTLAVYLLSLVFLEIKNKGKILLKTSNFYLFLTGVSASLAFWSKQSYLLLIIFLVFFFVLLLFVKIGSLKKGIKDLFILLTGFFSVCTIFIFYFIITGAFRDWWLQSIRLGYILGRILSKDYSLYEQFKFLFNHFFWLVLPLSVFFLLFMYLRRLLTANKIVKNIYLVGICFILIASLLQYFPISDYSHMYWAATPAFGFFVFFIKYLFKNLHKRSISRNRYGFFEKNSQILILFIIFLTCFSLVFEVKERIIGGSIKIINNYSQVDEPKILRGMRVEKRDAEYYTSVSRNIDKYFLKNPNKKFVIMGSDALYMTFTDHAQNITPLYANFSGSTSGIYPYDQKLIEYIHISEPLILASFNNFKMPKGYYVIKIWKENRMLLIAPH